MGFGPSMLEPTSPLTCRPMQTHGSLPCSDGVSGELRWQNTEHRLVADPTGRPAAAEVGYGTAVSKNLHSPCKEQERSVGEMCQPEFSSAPQY